MAEFQPYTLEMKNQAANTDEEKKMGMIYCFSKRQPFHLTLVGINSAKVGVLSICNSWTHEGLSI